MIFRHDDVSPSTDIKKLKEIHDFLKCEFPSCEIWSCVNIFGRGNGKQSVYPDLPLKNKSLCYLYDVNINLSDEIIFDLGLRGSEEIVSHGLIHADHSRLGYETQEMSILTSCRFLNTDIFVPPFNAFNQHTQAICDIHGIHLVKPSDGWKSVETSKFDKKHNLWFFHSWRYKTAQDFIDSVQQRKPIGGNGLWWLK